MYVNYVYILGSGLVPGIFPHFFFRIMPLLMHPVSLISSQLSLGSIFLFQFAAAFLLFCFEAVCVVLTL